MGSHLYAILSMVDCALGLSAKMNISSGKFLLGILSQQRENRLIEKAGTKKWGHCSRKLDRVVLRPLKIWFVEKYVNWG